MPGKRIRSKDRNINIRIGEALLEEIDDICKEKHYSKSDLIRIAIREKINSIRTGPLTTKENPITKEYEKLHSLVKKQAELQNKQLDIIKWREKLMNEQLEKLSKTEKDPATRIISLKKALIIQVLKNYRDTPAYKYHKTYMSIPKMGKALNGSVKSEEITAILRDSENVDFSQRGKGWDIID